MLVFLHKMAFIETETALLRVTMPGCARELPDTI